MFRSIVTGAATVIVAAAIALTGTAGTALADVHQRGASTIVRTGVVPNGVDPDVVAYGLAGTREAAIYLYSVRTNISSFHAMADDHSTLTMGVSMCQAFGRGVTVTQLANIGMQNGFTPFETGVLMGAATSQFCPEYAPVMRAELTSGN